MPSASARSAVGWDSDPAVEAVSFPRLDGDVTADACVVGLGGSGLAAIGELLRRGLSVVGLDGGKVAAGAAGRNGGFLLAGPASAVHRAAAAWGTAYALELYRETLDELDALEAALGPDVIRRVGSIRLAGPPGPAADDGERDDRTAEFADCQEQYEFLRSHAIAVERYEGALGSGIFLPDDAAMNPVRRARGLAAIHGRRSRLYEHSPVTAISSGQVVTAHGSVSTGVVIVAVDGGLELILPELTGRVRTGRLQMLATAPVEADRLPCPVYARWGYDYAQQDRSGRVFVGGGRDRFVEQEWTTDTAPTPPVQNWIGRLAERFVGGPVEVTHRWAASVGYTPDGRPLVTEARPGVLACGGYCGTGNLVGPVAARAAVALALDATPPRPYFAG
ncbi:MAG: NAD(P)/FAD-dependent oxidoreductase [Jatrophihabitantaceae bacterium]